MQRQHSRRRRIRPRSHAPRRTRPPITATSTKTFFARDPDHAEGPIDAFYGCGCSLIRRDALPAAQPFSIARNEIGGEDDLLFQHMQARGARFAFAPLACVSETPEPSRVSLTYTLRRAFAYGQGPATHAWFAETSRSSSPWRSGWLVGIAQAIVWGFVAIFAYSFQTRRRAFVYRRFVEGVGKTFWFPLLKPRFYGAAKPQGPTPTILAHGA